MNTISICSIETTFCSSFADLLTVPERLGLPGAHKGVVWLGSEATLERFDKLRHAKGSVSTAALRLEMQRVMQSNCAVFRTGEVLQEGVDLMKEAWAKRADIGVNDRSMIWNSDLVST